MREVRAMSRAGRENQILVALYLQWDKYRISGATAYTIAAKIGMRPTSPRFRDILRGMVESGKLIAAPADYTKPGKLKNGASGRVWYSVPMEDLDRGAATKKKIASETRKSSNSLQLRLI